MLSSYLLLLPLMSWENFGKLVNWADLLGIAIFFAYCSSCLFFWASSNALSFFSWVPPELIALPGLLIDYYGAYDGLSIFFFYIDSNAFAFFSVDTGGCSTGAISPTGFAIGFSFSCGSYFCFRLFSKGLLIFCIDGRLFFSASFRSYSSFLLS